MKKINYYINKLKKKGFQHLVPAKSLERGQILIIVTLLLTGLVAFVGLVIDTGLVFVGQGKLRNSVDAAALAAASNFRLGFDKDDLEDAAYEFLILNGIGEPEAVISFCDIDELDDPELCPADGEEWKKVVRVDASATVQLAFLRVIGINEIEVYASAIGEAASMDVVLVLDTSDSMGKDTGNNNDIPDNDPFLCNQDNSCHPFDDVKSAAAYFVSQLTYPYDRVAVVGFDKNISNELAFTNVLGDITTAIGNMEIFEPGNCTNDVFWNPLTNKGPCRKYLPDIDPPYDDIYQGLDCPWHTAHGNPGGCTTTNIGSALQEAGNILADTGRREAHWVVVLLTDGAANSSPTGDYCTNWWWLPPYCRSKFQDDNWTRYCFDNTYTWCLLPNADGGPGGVLDADPANRRYNTDDFARDMFDYVGRTQGATIYTIGLGNIVTTSLPIVYGEAAGERLLAYGASQDVGDGLYIQSSTSSALDDAFDQILDQVATRLSK